MLDLSKANGDHKEPEEKKHTFTFQDSQGRMVQMRIPHKAMKQCFCGCDRFVPQYHIGWGKPAGMLGAEPMQLKVELYVCVECGEMLLPSHPMVGDPSILKGSMLDKR
jgi:hypothetical protein